MRRQRTKIRTQFFLILMLQYIFVHNFGAQNDKVDRPEVACLSLGLTSFGFLLPFALRGVLTVSSQSYRIKPGFKWSFRLLLFLKFCYPCYPILCLCLLSISQIRASDSYQWLYWVYSMYVVLKAQNKFVRNPKNGRTAENLTRLKTKVSIALSVIEQYYLLLWVGIFIETVHTHFRDP